jgi:hypothetical protein
MNSSTYLPTKSLLAVATALVCAAGFARADDNSLRRFSGDGYAYFSESKRIPAIPAIKPVSTTAVTSATR